MVTPPELQEAKGTSDATDISALEARILRLEERSSGRSRVLELAVVVGFLVLSGLLILHWAGHFFRHGA